MIDLNHWLITREDVKETRKIGAQGEEKGPRMAGWGRGARIRLA